MEQLDRCFWGVWGVRLVWATCLVIGTLGAACSSPHRNLGTSGTGGASAMPSGGASGGEANVAGVNAGPTGGGDGGTEDEGGRGGSSPSGGSSGIGRVVGVVGSACTAKEQCDSGFCTDGVCCDASCSGKCEQCSKAGHCEMPDDDVDCGTIVCAKGTDCRAYPASIDDHRCKARGTCKSAADCSGTDVPARMPCGTDKLHMICDGFGACQTPTVPCGIGTGTCPVSSNGICCGHSADGGYAMCNISPADCEPAIGQSTIPIECNQALDCATSTVCCYQIYKYGSWMRCVPPSECVSNGATNDRQMCNPNDPNPCPFASTCTAADATLESYMSSYHYCN